MSDGQTERMFKKIIVFLTVSLSDFTPIKSGYVFAAIQHMVSGSLRFSMRCANETKNNPP